MAIYSIVDFSFMTASFFFGKFVLEGYKKIHFFLYHFGSFGIILLQKRILDVKKTFTLRKISMKSVRTNSREVARSE